MYDVVIVGAGPAGIFAALELVAGPSGPPRILMLEKGLDVERRNCPSREVGGGCRYCSPCNALCGWGGAGAFSDGKLTLSAQVGGSLEEYVGEERLAGLIREVDEAYLRFGAPETLYGVAREEEIREIERRALQAELKLVPIPIRHMGTGRCRDILRRMRDFLLDRGVTIRTCRPVADFVVDGRSVAGVRTADGEEIAARFVVVAPGREGAGWLAAQAGRLGLEMAINPVDIGVRVELPAATMDHLTRVCYESKFIYYSKTFHDRVRTFCMNPYGEVVMENNNGLITVNGHSHAYRKTSNTNFSVLVSKTFTEPFR
ncbi:MAG: FAD-dependent oxidoreductase, partial [Firmicutes bacterium]|nr:FAD-dependent oxidoreductase [Bacillota bacterium]